MNKAFITGISGYVGSHLAHYLLSKGWRISGLIRETSSLTYLENISSGISLFNYGGITTLIDALNESQPDVVFHLAACSGAGKNTDIRTLIDSNILLGTELLEAMKVCGCKHIVNTGTYWQNYQSQEYNPVDLYAATKEAFEKLLKYYTEVENIRAITLRLFDIYGPNDNRPKLLNVIQRIANTGESLRISPGEQLLDMVYITDICRAYEQAYHLFSSDVSICNEVFGVYTNQRVSLKRLVNEYVKLLGKPVNIIYGGKPYKRREIMTPASHLRLLPGWQAEVTLEEGLAKLIHS